MLKIAIAVGDPAGIGPEIALKALEDKSFNQSFFSKAIPILYASQKVMKECAQHFNPNLSFTCIQSESQATNSQSIYLIDTGDVSFKPNIISKETGLSAYRSLICAANAAKNRAVSAICTGPIHKQALRMAGIQEIGHTEILAKVFDAKTPLTLFVTCALRIFFYTRHLSLQNAIRELEVSKLVTFAQDCHTALQQLGFPNPHLALAALNPHASDGGQFGSEENTILSPAVLAAQKMGIHLTGPIPADSVFAQAAKGNFDAVLSLYHDQGHIAAKTYNFDKTISATLGLPVLRTSVDHGTALDIAWQNKAQCISMQEALMFAANYAF